MLYLMLFILVGSVNCVFYRNIQDDPFSCNLTLSGNTFNFTRSYYSISYQNETIYFSPCLQLEARKCSKAAMLCVKTNSGATNFETFKSLNDTSVELHAKNCRAIIGITQDLEPQITKIQKGCGYILKIPNPNVKSTCTKEIGNDTLDFSQLDSDLEIFTNDTRIFVNLCRPSTRCKDNMSSICLLTSNQSTSLGYAEKRTISYSVDTGVEFHFKTDKKGPLTIVYLKCNWTVLSDNIDYQALSTKKHKITMDSYLGCVKLPPNCVISFENVVYNLTGLNNPQGWKVANNLGKNITINICGPLFTNNNCPDYAQVCDYTNGLQLNYGTSMTTLILDKDNNNNLKATFKDGSTCPRNLDQSLSTNVNFICSFEERPPILRTVNECSYVIDWYTPKACPKLIELNSTPAIFKPCTITKDHKIYDLSELTLNTSNYVIGTPGNVDYIINVCRSIVVDEDNNCQPTMGICSRNNSEPNIRNRFFNIGNVQEPTIENGELILRYKSGSISRLNNKEASAVIVFHCSDREDGPTFTKEHSSTTLSYQYLFTWKTKHACPKEKECLLGNSLGHNVSLINAERRIFKFTEDKTQYTLDICAENITFESNGVVHNFKTERTIQNDDSNLYIQYVLDRTCEKGSFNIIHVHPKCDIITSNEHYDFENIKDCILNIDFKHHLICDLFNGNGINNTVEEIKIVKKEPEVQKECTYQYHGREININSLRSVTVMSPTNRNYTIGFNHDGGCDDFICRGNEILANLDDCPKAKDENDELTLSFVSNLNYTVDVSFQCRKLDDTAKILREETSLAYFQYPLDEVCFETKNNNLFYIVGSVVSVFVIIICLLVYKRDLIRHLCHRGSKRSVYVYCKNSDD